MPAEEDALLGPELEEDWLDVELWGAEPGIEVGIPALGLLELELPEPLEDEEEEEEDEDEDDEGEPDEPPLGEGIPEEPPPEDTVQPASANRLPDAAATRTAARCNGAARSLAVRFMVIAPSGTSVARSETCCRIAIRRGCRSSVGFSS